MKRVGEGVIQPRLSHSKSESAAVRRAIGTGDAKAETAKAPDVFNPMELDQYQLEPDEVDESKSELIQGTSSKILKPEKASGLTKRDLDRQEGERMETIVSDDDED